MAADEPPAKKPRVDIDRLYSGTHSTACLLLCACMLRQCSAVQVASCRHAINLDLATQTACALASSCQGLFCATHCGWEVMCVLTRQSPSVEPGHTYCYAVAKGHLQAASSPQVGDIILALGLQVTAPILPQEHPAKPLPKSESPAPLQPQPPPGTAPPSPPLSWGSTPLGVLGAIPKPRDTAWDPMLRMSTRWWSLSTTGASLAVGLLRPSPSGLKSLLQPR